MVSFTARFTFFLSLLLGIVSGFAPIAYPGVASRQSTKSQLCMAEDGITKGKVKWFNTQKGFGFISPEDGSSDVFVHQTNIQMEGFRSLADGEDVEYVVEIDGNGRKKAVSVTGPAGADVQGAPFQPSNDYDRY